MVRTFLAIDLPLDLKRELSNLRKVALPEDNKLKWVEEENFHLTLKFLGNIPESLIEKIYKSCVKVCEEFSSFPLELGEVGVFPEKGIPRVIWIGIEKAQDQLLSLYKGIEKALKSLKLEKKKESFHPHITLIRVKEVKDPSALNVYLVKLKSSALPLKGRAFLVKELTLFKSELSLKGPKYTPLKQIFLKDFTN